MGSQQYLRSLYFFLSPLNTAAIEMNLTCKEACLYFCFNNLPSCLPPCLTLWQHGVPQWPRWHFESHGTCLSSSKICLVKKQFLVFTGLLFPCVGGSPYFVSSTAILIPHVPFTMSSLCLGINSWASPSSRLRLVGICLNSQSFRSRAFSKTSHSLGRGCQPTQLVLNKGIFEGFA